MGKGAPLRWLENRWLRRFLRGQGVEIGALWRRFPVPKDARVWYVDRLDPRALEQTFTAYEKVVPPDLVAEADALPLASGSLDFLIAGHVLEHLFFPLRTLRAWYEMLAPGGALLLRVPDKRFTFDVRRARTPLAHLLEEEERPERYDREAHYADFVEHVRGWPRSDPRYDAEMKRLMGEDHRVHFHVWTDEDVRELIEFTQQSWRLAWEPKVFWRAHFYRKECIVLLQKSGGPESRTA